MLWMCAQIVAAFLGLLLGGLLCDWNAVGDVYRFFSRFRSRS